MREILNAHPDDIRLSKQMHGSSLNYWADKLFHKLYNKLTLDEKLFVKDILAEKNE